jgi:hypothetical protein
VEHPFDESLTPNRRSWDDAVRTEHLYDQPVTAGEVEMAAVPIERSVRRPYAETRHRLRLVDAGIHGERAGSGRARSPQRAATRRRLGTLAAVCGLVGLWFGTGALTTSSRPEITPTPRVASGEVYVVRAGDTLVSIAESLVPRRDVPALVRLLALELRGNFLRPGTVLRLPSGFAARSNSRPSG